MANANSSQTGLMAEYNAADCTHVVDGAVAFGFNGSDMVSWDWDNDKASLAGDSMGTFVLSDNNKNSGKVTYNLDQESPFNKNLADLCNANKTFPIDIRSTTEHVWGDHCKVSRIPAGSNGDNSGNRPWVVIVTNLMYERLDSNS
ncbi:hypothetical protein OF387_17105 [Lentilactobacillus hilgardii]|nr:hypothetical protein [Lentilactobacillus hilgardii]MCV3742956.1 hypothetical protein [Lentilactobacillus hilgardii]